jgi:hypothetical protein
MVPGLGILPKSVRYHTAPAIAARIRITKTKQERREFLSFTKGVLVPWKVTRLTAQHHARSGGCDRRHRKSLGASQGWLI